MIAGAGATGGLGEGRIRRVQGVLALGLMLGVLVAFFPVLGADFVLFDDPTFVLENEHVHGLSMDNVRWMFLNVHDGHYQPLTFLSYAIEHELWGLNPLGYHAVNLVLHAISTLLVFALTLTIMQLSAARAGGVREPVIACIAAAFWGVHPLRVESVAWITERRDVLSVGLLLLATLVHLRAVDPARKGVGRRAGLALASLLLCLSVLSKAWGMSFFVVALLLDVYPLRRAELTLSGLWSRRGLVLLIEKMPYVVVGALAAAMASHAQHEAGATKSLAHWGIESRIAQSMYGLAWYLWKTALPTGLCVLRELPDQLGVLHTGPLLASATVLGVLVWCVFARRRHPGAWVSWAMYLVLVAPVLGLLQSGDQLVADRYAYLATIPLTIGLGVLISGYLANATRARRVIGGAIAGVVLLVLTIASFNQTLIWRSTLALWSHAYAIAPTPLVAMNLAAELSRQEQDTLAMSVLRPALEARPSLGKGWFLLGQIQREQGQFNEAERSFRKAIEVGPRAYASRVNLGAMYLKQLSRPDDAIREFRLAVEEIEREGRAQPSGVVPSALPYLALGDALKRTGNLEEAQVNFEKALRYEESRSSAQRELETLRNSRPQP